MVVIAPECKWVERKTPLGRDPTGAGLVAELSAHHQNPRPFVCLLAYTCQVCSLGAFGTQLQLRPLLARGSVSQQSTIMHCSAM
jgi:hypothetical protein